jgi:hypothetical protein
MITPIRVGLIGTGFSRRVAAPVDTETDGFALADVVNPRDEAAVRALCRRDDLELISIHSPSFLHLDHVRQAVQAGHAVLCDKPCGLNAEEVAEMRRLADDTGVLHIVNFEFRNHPVRRRMRELLQAGVVGTVEHVAWTSWLSFWRAERGRTAGSSTRTAVADGFGSGDRTSSTSCCGRSARSSTPMRSSAGRCRSVLTPTGTRDAARRRPVSSRRFASAAVPRSCSTRRRPRGWTASRARAWSAAGARWTCDCARRS